MKAGQKQKKSSIIYLTLMLSAVFITSTLFGILKPSVASAATFSELSIEEKAKVWVMGRAVSKCVSKIGFWHDNFSESDGANGEWLADDSGWGNQDANQELGEWTADIAEGNSDDAKVTCKKVAKVTLELMGVSVKDALCEMNELAGKTLWKRESGDCLNGAGDFDLDEDDVEEKDTDIWNDFFRKWLGSGIDASLTPGMRYVIYSENFYQECGNGEGGGWGTPREWRSGDDESDKVYKLKWNKEGATPDKDWYVAAQEHNRDHSVDIDGYGMLTSDDNLQCETLADRINGNADAYLEELARSENPDDDPDDGGSGITDPDDAETTCAIDGIGWIVCPVMTFMGKLNNLVLDYLISWLTVPANALTDTPTKTAWDSFRNIANAVFVIAFLIIMYSQITGAGITNYGIKRLLPKLIMVAILVNISYYICLVAVDISNILGTSIKSFFDAIPTGQNSIVDAGANGWDKAIAAILIAGVGLGLLVAVILAPSVLLVFMMIFLILVGRQAAIILLTVISPLAFVAYLLPNTESLFTKWRKMYWGLLMVFPIIAAVFGGASLASKVIGNVAGDDEQTLAIIALSIQAIPLFAVPILLKGALAATGSIGAKISGLQDRTNRRAGRGIKEGRIGEAKTAFDRRRDLRSMSRRRGEGRIAQWGRTRQEKGKRGGTALEWLGTRQKALDESSPGRYLGGDRGAAAAVAGIHKDYDDNVKNQKALLSGRTNEQLLQIMRNKEGSSEFQAAAAGLIMSRDHRDSHLEALRIAGQRGQDKSDSVISDVQKQMAYDMKDKPFALGDQAAGQLGVGQYGKEFEFERPDGTKQKGQLGNLDAEFKDRLQNKLSASGVASMNPDELKLAHRMATNGELDAAQLGNLQQSIKDAAKDARLKVLIKPEAATLHTQILSSTPKP